ncbi:MAG: N-acetylneuraminate synthase family protein, partial [Candidatus Hadarchaeales archaeon]
HTDGASEMAFIVPLLAVALGATILEKHITHNREFKGEDFESALDPAGFRKFVQHVREIEKSLGSGFVRPLSDSELEYRLIARKRAVASRDIKKGESITRNLIAFKRSDEGVFPDEIGFILGRKVVKDIKKNEGITVDKVE